MMNSEVQNMLKIFMKVLTFNILSFLAPRLLLVPKNYWLLRHYGDNNLGAPVQLILCMPIKK